MKFLHIADVHLGVEPDAGRPWSEKRKQDIWDSFFEVLEVVRREQVELLLVAGDLFHRQPLKRELKEVAAQFAAVPDTEVVLIAGNHDYLHPKSYYRGFEWPNNVHMICSEQLESMRLERLDTTVWGASFWKAEDDRKLYDDVVLPTDKTGYHILLGHGGDEKHHPFSWRKVADAGFDYAAFGHIHKAGQIFPQRIVMAGALEPTDCNDFGPHGMWLGQLDETGCKVQFLPIKKCEYIRQELVVDAKMTASQILAEVSYLLQEREPYQISHVRLVGYRDGDIVIEKEKILQLDRVVRVEDETVPDYRFEKLKEEHQETLFGNFIEALQDHPDQPVAKKALYYGVWAMLEAMGE